MQATQAYAAKRALFAALAAQTGTGQPLEGVQVAYAYPARDLERQVIYGGGVQFTHIPAAAEAGTVVTEIATISVYVRVLRLDEVGVDVEDVDADVEAIADAVTGVLTANPELAGGLTVAAVSSGDADYSRPPGGMESVMSLRVEVEALLA